MSIDQPPTEAETLRQGTEAPFSLWPKTMGAFVAARLGHRLAMHVPMSHVRLRSTRPIVSFTFDDVPRSAARTGADLLSEYEAHGTFYAAGDLTGTDCRDWVHADAADLVTLHRRGHEIGCHTFSHRKVYEFDGFDLLAQIERNQAYFRALDPSIELRNFAYPWGLGSFPLKRALGKHFRSCRGIMPGINHGRIDLQFLRSIHLIDGLIDAAGIDQAMDEAIKINGWLIFYSHDVELSPSVYGCSPKLLTHALKAAARRNMLMASVAEALEFAGI